MCLSLAQYQHAEYAEAIASARRALQLDPNSVGADTNIGAAYGALRQWDEAIRNEHEALRLRPDFQLAKNNLAWYEQASKGPMTLPKPWSSRLVVSVSSCASGCHAGMRTAKRSSAWGDASCR